MAGVGEQTRFYMIIDWSISAYSPVNQVRGGRYFNYVDWIAELFESLSCPSCKYRSYGRSHKTLKLPFTANIKRRFKVNYHISGDYNALCDRPLKRITTLSATYYRCVVYKYVLMSP